MPYKTGQNAAATVLRNPANIEAFVLKQQAPGSRTAGIFQPGAVTETDLEGSIQALDGKSREELPEAERLFDAISIHFETTDHEAINPLKIGTNQADSDIIEWNNLEWAVRVVHDMATFGNIEVFATRLENQDDN